MTTAVKPKPIIFSPSMAQAIHEGRKTQTRRIVKPQPLASHLHPQPHDAPYQPGDVLYVRESFFDAYCKVGRHGRYIFRGDEPKYDCRWSPSIHMPLAAARSFLEVTAVRCERVQEISIEDQRAEGCPTVAGARECAFAVLWDSLHGSGAWARNDWVFVYEFKKIEKP